MEMSVNLLRGSGWDDSRQGLEAGLRDAAQAAKVLQQALPGTSAYAGDGEEL